MVSAGDIWQFDSTRPVSPGLEKGGQRQRKSNDLTKYQEDTSLYPTTTAPGKGGWIQQKCSAFLKLQTASKGSSHCGPPSGRKRHYRAFRPCWEKSMPPSSSPHPHKWTTSATPSSYVLLPPLFFRTLERLTEAVPSSSFLKVWQLQTFKSKWLWAVTFLENKYLIHHIQADQSLLSLRRKQMLLTIGRGKENPKQEDAHMTPSPTLKADPVTI